MPSSNLNCAAKAIRFSSVAGIKDGIVVEAPITIANRQSLFALIDLLSKTGLSPVTAFYLPVMSCCSKSS